MVVKDFCTILNLSQHSCDIDWSKIWHTVYFNVSLLLKTLKKTCSQLKCDVITWYYNTKDKKKISWIYPETEEAICMEHIYMQYMYI